MDETKTKIKNFSGAGRTIILILSSIQLWTSGLVFAQYSYIPLSIQMRDGKYLAADLYTIDTTMARPTILIQTPYNKFWYRFNMGNPNWQIPYDSLRYNYLIADWRGFYGSAPADSVGYDRGLDGYDLVEFIASKPWSNGRVGTWGASALGVIQFMTAKHRPPHLYCSVPMVADSKTAYTDYFYGGDYLKELTQMRAALGFLPESLILAHYRYDIYWWLAEMYTSYPESINVPMLLITGWYDHNLDSPLIAFYALRDSSDQSVRDKHKILIGPWTHGELGRLDQGELAFPDAVDSVRMPSFRIFDYYLCNINNGYESEPAIRFYTLGADTWKSTDDWFAYGNRSDTLYLQANGLLSDNPPGTANPPDSFPYDPRYPAPSIGGIRFNPFNNNVIVGPRDQRDSVEARSDILTYTTAVFAEPLVIAGAITVKLDISSNCEDTDLSVRLTDVYPDNRSMLVTEGIRRMRFRNSYGQEELMVPGDTYSVFIELRNIAYTYLPGHRLRIIVSSSDYPIFDINLNNGDSLYMPGDTVVARNWVYHEPDALSMIVCKTRAGSGIADGSNINCHKAGLKARLCNGVVTFEFQLDHISNVNLDIYDTAGRKITAIARGRLKPGIHKIRFDLGDTPRGVYFLRLQVDDRQVSVTELINITE
jgi:predicted acyl esterase